MTHAQKVANALKSIVSEGSNSSHILYKNLWRYCFQEGDSFDTQYYFNSFYLSFSYYKGTFNSMTLYLSKYDVKCSMISLESTGDIIIGQAGEGDITIYNGCTPIAQNFEILGLDISVLPLLYEVHRTVEPIMYALAKKMNI